MQREAATLLVGRSSDKPSGQGGRYADLLNANAGLHSLSPNTQGSSMKTPMLGKAVRWPESGVLTRLQYAKHPHENVWYAMTPNGLLANLKKHTVTEHDNGMITVQPSILVNGGRRNEWHGFLENGYWREA